jgi:hypothetical protein
LKKKILGKMWQIKENALPRSGAKMGLAQDTMWVNAAEGRVAPPHCHHPKGGAWITDPF